MIELVVQERKEWVERVEVIMGTLGFGKFTPEETQKAAENKMVILDG